MIETWLAVPGFEGLYEISDLGRFKRIAPDRMGRTPHTNKVLKPMMGARGYHIYSFWKDGVPHSKIIHRLVARAFLGEPGTMVVNHKNGIKTDNRLENLEYVTQKENYRHALDVLHFKPSHGETHWKATLTDEQVEDICRRLQNGEKQSVIGKEYGLRPSLMCDYAHGRSRARKHINASP